MNKNKPSFTDVLSPIFKIVICGYILYIFLFEKNLRKHSPINLDTILMLLSAMWLIGVISDSFKVIKTHLGIKKRNKSKKI